jgi:hypothetical protein
MRCQDDRRHEALGLRSIVLGVRPSLWVLRPQVGLLYQPLRMKHWWNDNWQGKLKGLEKNLSHCPVFCQKHHVDYPGIESWPL